ncbi:MAG: RNA methyltransferase [Bdellovibrionales bacterium]|nr:RNA methyltransferase [Bdellovibrionales bacterium]
MSSSIRVDVEGWNEIEEALSSPFVSVHQFRCSKRDAAKARDLMATYKCSLKKLLIEEGPPTRSNQQKRVRASVLTIELSLFRSLNEWRHNSPKGSHRSLALALDQIQDPQNLGALIRSAHFFGAEFVMFTKDRSCPVTSSVVRASAGAIFSLGLLEVPNLAREIDAVRKEGSYILGLDASSKQVLPASSYVRDSVLLIVGSEGDGLRHLTKKKCDFLYALTEKAGRDSLNASVAGAIALFQLS